MLKPITYTKGRNGKQPTRAKARIEARKGHHRRPRGRDHNKKPTFRKKGTKKRSRIMRMGKVEVERHLQIKKTKTQNLT